MVKNTTISYIILYDKAKFTADLNEIGLIQYMQRIETYKFTCKIYKTVYIKIDNTNLIQILIIKSFSR